jgi:hypothetical protein
VESTSLARIISEPDLIEGLRRGAVSLALAEHDAEKVRSAFVARDLADRLNDRLEALIQDPENALKSSPKVLRWLADTAEGASCESSTPWKTLGELRAQDLPTPHPVVDGIIRRGELGVIGGASKSFKSWAALDLALAVACGRTWLGRPCTKGSVLFVNLELPEWCVRSRLNDIASARGDITSGDNLKVWTLRGSRPSAERIRSVLKASRPDDLALVVVDPVYMLLAGRDENSAGDIADLLFQLSGIASETGAAVILPAHFAKGDASAKSAQDRVSGSGVFARFPDTLLTLTQHEEDGSLTVEAILRTFPPVEPFVVTWQHPVFHVDSRLDPERLKKRGGRTEKYSDKEILGPLADEPLTYTEWLEALSEKGCEIHPRTFRDRLKRLKSSTAITHDPITEKYRISAPTSDRSLRGGAGNHNRFPRPYPAGDMGRKGQ